MIMITMMAQPPLPNAACCGNYFNHDDDYDCIDDDEDEDNDDEDDDNHDDDYEMFR